MFFFSQLHRQLKENFTTGLKLFIFTQLFDLNLRENESRVLSAVAYG
jgi:hypothetical protein